MSASSPPSPVQTNNFQSENTALSAAGEFTSFANDDLTVDLDSADPQRRHPPQRNSRSSSTIVPVRKPRGRPPKTRAPLSPRRPYQASSAITSTNDQSPHSSPQNNNAASARPPTRGRGRPPRAIGSRSSPSTRVGRKRRLRSTSPSPAIGLEPHSDSDSATNDRQDPTHTNNSSRTPKKSSTTTLRRPSSSSSESSVSDKLYAPPNKARKLHEGDDVRSRNEALRDRLIATVKIEKKMIETGEHPILKTFGEKLNHEKLARQRQAENVLSLNLKQATKSLEAGASCAWQDFIESKRENRRQLLGLLSYKARGLHREFLEGDPLKVLEEDPAFLARFKPRLPVFATTLPSPLLKPQRDVRIKHILAKYAPSSKLDHAGGNKPFSQNQFLGEPDVKRDSYQVDSDSDKAVRSRIAHHDVWSLSSQEIENDLILSGILAPSSTPANNNVIPISPVYNLSVQNDPNSRSLPYPLQSYPPPPSLSQDEASQYDTNVPRSPPPKPEQPLISKRRDPAHISPPNPEPSLYISSSSLEHQQAPRAPRNHSHNLELIPDQHVRNQPHPPAPQMQPPSVLQSSSTTDVSKKGQAKKSSGKSRSVAQLPPQASSSMSLPYATSPQLQYHPQYPALPPHAQQMMYSPHQSAVQFDRRRRRSPPPYPSPVTAPTMHLPHGPSPYMYDPAIPPGYPPTPGMIAGPGYPSTSYTYNPYWQHQQQDWKEPPTKGRPPYSSRGIPPEYPPGPGPVTGATSRSSPPFAPPPDHSLPFVPPQLGQTSIRSLVPATEPGKSSKSSSKSAVPTPMFSPTSTESRRQHSSRAHAHSSLQSQQHHTAPSQATDSYREPVPLPSVHDASVHLSQPKNSDKDKHSSEKSSSRDTGHYQPQSSPDALLSPVKRLKSPEDEQQQEDLYQMEEYLDGDSDNMARPIDEKTSGIVGDMPLESGISSSNNATDASTKKKIASIRTTMEKQPLMAFDTRGGSLTGTYKGVSVKGQSAYGFPTTPMTSTPLRGYAVTGRVWGSPAPYSGHPTPSRSASASTSPVASKPDELLPQQPSIKKGPGRPPKAASLADRPRSASSTPAGSAASNSPPPENGSSQQHQQDGMFAFVPYARRKVRRGLISAEEVEAVAESGTKSTSTSLIQSDLTYSGRDKSSESGNNAASSADEVQSSPSPPTHEEKINSASIRPISHFNAITSENATDPEKKDHVDVEREPGEIIENDLDQEPQSSTNATGSAFTPSVPAMPKSNISSAYDSIASSARSTASTPIIPITTNAAAAAAAAAPLVSEEKLSPTNNSTIPPTLIASASLT